jgi:cupin fold WbuC family metalloprotein
MDAIRWIDHSMLDELIQQAAGTQRRRLNHNFHHTLEENPHRFLNAMMRGTYVRPHRHLIPPKPESFVLLSGAVIFLIFDDDGSINESRLIASPALLSEAECEAKITFEKESRRLIERCRENPAMGVDIDPGIWHTLLPVTDVAVIFEVKPGPYTPADDKEFASWAPPENHPDAKAYLDSLYKLCYGES